MRCAFRLVCLLLACTTASAEAELRRIALGPPACEVGFRAYGLGLVPIDGKFTRFTGWLTYDPDDHAACHVDLAVEVASLVTDDASMRDTVVGSDFMDAAHFPSLDYAGDCREQGMAGLLGMHGVRRPFELALSWSRDRVGAEGRLRRAEWGMTAMPILGGRTVRISVSIPLPRP
jgi:polyisoprenoid-binding protein YceI